jgi:mono/diheme cytochrome c family protein
MRLEVLFANNVILDVLKNPINLRSIFIISSVLLGLVVVAILFNQNLLGAKEKTPQNIKEFYDDETLETKRLERTLGIALGISAVLAVSLAAYWLWEPNRQAQSQTGYEQKSVRRGQALYAKEGDPGYSSVNSLGCSGCHGGYNSETKTWSDGGSASYVVPPAKDPETDEACSGDNKFRNSDCVPAVVSWAAPALNNAFYKYPIIKADAENPFKSSCSLADQRTNPDCRSQIYDIIVYGRPGTPMPAWGTAGGGPKNEQSIEDIMAFLAEVQLDDKTILKNNNTEDLRESAIEKATEQLATAQKSLDEASDTLKNTENSYKSVLKQYEADSELDSFSDPQDYLDEIDKKQTFITLEKKFDSAQGKKRIKASKALDELTERLNITKLLLESRDALANATATKEIFAPLAVENATARLNQLKGATDGQVLFEQNCATCHTKGWSFSDFSDGRVPTPSEPGSGAFGPALHNQGLISQFPDSKDMVSFVSTGSQFQKPYGTRGIGSGRMPGFGMVLSEKQIEQIVEYERSLGEEGQK